MNIREEQSRRELEYGKELEEIMKRVSEQKLLLERQSKVIFYIKVIINFLISV